MKWLLTAIIIVVVLTGIYLFTKESPSPIKQSADTLLNQTTMTIKSSAFRHNELIPKKYTCDGEDVNPPLQIDGVPPETESLVLIVDDPDAPAGTWVHWTVWNINPEITVIAENSSPAGAIEGLTDFGKSGYGGPCPPINPDPSVGAGTHRYFFKIYALNTMPNLTPDARKADIEKTMQGHIIAKAELIGLYKRQ